MPISPPYLKKGDKIAIICPAKKLPRSIEKAVEILKSWGLEIYLGVTIGREYHQFSGNDNLRGADLQIALDDPEIKAIIAGRGGYGTIRIIDRLDFTKFRANPKWLIGFSDFTIMLSHLLATQNTQSIHGQMPYTFDEATPESLESLRIALFGGPLRYEIKRSKHGRAGEAEGVLIGGNLTLLTTMIGSKSDIDFSNKILFLEDVGEHEYAIDRMMRMLYRAGKLANLKGLIIGAFNERPPETIPFGYSVEKIIMDLLKLYKYPVCFDFPVGHIDDNRAMIVGKKVKLLVTRSTVVLDQP